MTTSGPGRHAGETKEGKRNRSQAKRLREQRLWQAAGLAAALVPMLIGPARAQNIPANDQVEKPAKEVKPAAAKTLNNLQEAFATIADNMEPAVVTISSTRTYRSASSGDSEDGMGRGIFPPRSGPRRATGTGSGVIIRPEGWILTNDHVVGGADRVTVKLHDGREFVGTVRRDYRSDLALVKINDAKPFPSASLGDSDTLKTGYWAIAIGSPYKYEGSFSVGVISSLYRSHTIRDGGMGPSRLYPNLIQTDAAINPGNSGGPLVNLNGEVIGINTAIESEGGGSVGIGFAIPINAAKFVINQLLENGRVSYGFLGIDPTSVTPRTALALKVEQGALLRSDPAPGTPAAKAGLTAGDVITAIDNKPVRNELDLRTRISQTAPGTNIALSVMRDGEPKTISAVVEQLPREDPPLSKPADRGKAQLGLEVEPLTERLAQKAGVPPKTPGVVLKAVDQGSSAADVDELIDGIVIVRVNGKETPNVVAFRQAVTGLQSGDQVRVVYQIGRERHFVIVPVD